MPNGVITNRIDADLGGLDRESLFNIGRACTHPDIPDFDHAKTAMIIDRGRKGADTLSYKRLHELSNRFADVLSQHDIGKGDRVMLWLPNVAEFPVCFFGALKLGAIAVPSSILLTPDEIAFLADNSEAKVLVTTQDMFAKLPDSLFTDSKIEQVFITDPSEHLKGISHSLHTRLQGANDKDIERSTTLNDPAYLVYTSGTTGYPKGVLHAHRALLGRLPSAREWFDYAPEVDDRVLHSGKFNWTYVLGTALMDPLFLGKTVIVYEGESRADVWPQLIAKHHATIFIGVPTIYRQIIQKTSFNKKDVPSLRHCMSAGEHLSDDMLAAWKTRFEQNIYEAIGMSECSYYLSQHPSRQVKPGSAGRPQTGHRIALLDANLQPVADDEEGMLCIHQDDLGLFMEYWELPDTTQSAKQGEYFLTGDYARRDADGDIWFLGRKDDIINSFGFRISPMEIERVLKTHPDIADCVAVEEEVGPDKHIVTVCVILQANAELSEHALLTFASEHLAQYKVPKRAVFMTDFPRTANGKVLRKALKQTLHSG